MLAFFKAILAVVYYDRRGLDLALTTSSSSMGVAQWPINNPKQPALLVSDFVHKSETWI